MKPTVPGTGPTKCKICFVGEAPGGEESLRGKPFIGSDGELLNRLMHSAGIIRSQSYLTKVIKEQPANNAINLFINLAKKDVISTQDYKAYEAFLYEELSKIECNVIVAVGPVALYALTRKRGITKWRGSILSTPGGRKVIPILSPASAFKNYLYTYYILADLKRVKTESESSEIVLPKRKLKIRPSFQETMTYLNRILERKQPTAFDIETPYLDKVPNGQMNCCAFSLDHDDAISIPFTYEKGHYWTEIDEAQIMLKIAQILEDPDVPIIMQNGICFDAHFMLNRYGIKTKNILDTYVAHAVLYPDFPKGLGFMTSMFTREPYYKDDGKEGFADLQHFEEHWTYNAKDAAVTHEIYPKIINQLRQRENEQAYLDRIATADVTLYMQQRGLRVNKKALRAQGDFMETELEELHTKLERVIGRPVPITFPNSSKQLLDYFCGELGIPPYRKSVVVNGKRVSRPTYDDKALQRLAIRGYPAATVVKEIRALVKQRSTYMMMEFDEDERFRFSMNIVGTYTGRFGSSATIFGTGGNSQNLVSDFKKHIMADEGCFYVEADLSQAENRIVAMIAPEPNMKKAFAEGKDVHSLTYSMMLNMPIADVSREPGSSRLGDGSKAERDWGKLFNHSLNYDLGFKSFALKCGLTESEANKWVERYHTIYPAIRQSYHARIKARLSQDRTVENCYGHKCTLMDRIDDRMYKQAYAYGPQSTVATKINKDGLVYVYNNQSTFKCMEVVNQVHDSIVLQVHTKYGWEAISHTLCMLRLSLEKPIPWKEPIHIPADFMMGLNLDKKGGLVEIEDFSVEALKGVYDELRCTG